MVSINVTRVSSKGQIVIPSNMRKDLKEGDELLIIKDENRFIIKKEILNLQEELKRPLRELKLENT